VGKTTVCRLFSILGIPVYDADSQARWLLEHDPEVRRQITEIFGEQAYQPDGRYNRPWMAEQIFSSPVWRKKINDVVHPVVEAHSLQWHASQLQAPYTLKEAALLIESGSYRQLHFLIVVTAPLQTRIRRVMERDDTGREAVIRRIESQMPEEEKIPYAHLLIHNDEKIGLIRQVWAAHRQILQKMF
jgi:dephospho-CoA kinase